MPATISPVVQTIHHQLQALLCLPRGARFVLVDDLTLRVCWRRGGDARSVDIAYHPGSDTYTVKIHAFKLTDVTQQRTRTVDGLYTDQLADLFDATHPLGK